MELYHRITGKLKEYSVSDSDITRVRIRINSELDIPDQVERDYSLTNLMFNWIDRLWLRRSLVLISMSLLVLFVVQQAIMIDRIGSIEKRMTHTNIDNVLEYQRVMQSVSFSDNTVKGARETDSLKVSVRDLGALIESYREMQNSYRRLESLDISNRVPGKANRRDQI